MKAECVRDLNRKYLVMPDDSDGYQTEMLIRNKAEGFIPVKKIDWDNEIRLYYDITGKQSLDKGFVKRKISYQELSELLYSISCQVRECKRLFLDVSGIVLSPEYIFMDLSTERFYWIFYPCNRDSHEIMDLAEYLLEHIDNGNHAAVRTVYELYRRAKEGSIDAENLYEILKAEKEEEEIINTEISDGYQTDKKPVLKEKEEHKNKIERTIDRLFDLMKSKLPEKKVPEKEFDYERIDIDTDVEEDAFNDTEFGTVLISLPEGNSRKLISRDNAVPDAKLDFFPCVLGSRQDCVDILLNDRSVSRMHAQIDEAQGRLFLYDLNSTNGTFVNGQRLKSEEREIKEGDEIQIGNVRFVLA
ncbi:MAG: FHA domain-containing protein [Lachnospiraceae bacterium]|nr:FHA domain-containing protein [Lachnospiraceae bacterium]